MSDSTISFIAEMTKSKHPKEVQLTDTICVGCDNCGSCCINTEMKLTALDIYRIAKKVGIKTLTKELTFYFGDRSHLPIVGLFSSKRTSLCPFLKDTNDGDYQCSLGDAKPITCTHPFVAVGTAFNGKEFGFVPFDETVPKFDIDKYLQDYNISHNALYFIHERNDSCKAKNKKDMLVSDYLSERIKYDKEQSVASIISMLICKYVNVYELTRLLYLSEHSTVNKQELKSFFGEVSSYEKITRSLFSDIYFYTDIDSDESFMEQSIKHIHYLENKKYPLLRLLYKYFLVVFDPGKVTLQEILNTDDFDLAQERFDNYFSSNIEAIKMRFYRDMLPNMTKEMKDLKI